MFLMILSFLLEIKITSRVVSPDPDSSLTTSPNLEIFVVAQQVKPIKTSWLSHSSSPIKKYHFSVKIINFFVVL
jgi:hypothetical protein